MSDQTADNAKYGNWLIRLGAFLTANAELFPDGFHVWANSLEAPFYGENAKDNLMAAARAIRRQFAIKESAKEYQSSYFKMTMDIPASPYYFVLETPRTNVCRKVETGETITKTVPDYSKTPTKEVTEPVIKWECDPAILAD